MVCLWSLRSYTFIRNLTGGTRKTLYLLSSCDFSPDGALLATAAFRGSNSWIDLWDPYTAEKLTTLMCVQSTCSIVWRLQQISPPCGEHLYIWLNTSTLCFFLMVEYSNKTCSFINFKNHNALLTSSSLRPSQILTL